ncbi:hypothetical protein O5404_02575 [Borrelia miyamotoi]|uniref:Uncharacterized protein n=1 Tax=Borrelia miyamotoi TaxID=47466 RepID=A0AAX3JM31_9SPIR|nr:hypothetical protein [Borrelia miyamotoi]WAZ71896.1 hypothetical protein O5404_02575 [Borrelia miyamotoi]
MSLKYNEINVIIKELPLKNSFIRKIKQPSHKTLIIELYNKVEEKEKNFNILIELDPKKQEFIKQAKNLKTSTPI